MPESIRHDHTPARCPFCFAEGRVFCECCDNCGYSDCDCEVCACGDRVDETCPCCESCEACCECVRCASCGAPDSEPNCPVCSNCDECCGCPVCPGCDGRSGRMCRHCSRCGGCCECVICPGCDDRADDTCDRCDHCGRCCDCRNRRAVRYADYPLQFFPAARKEFAANPSRRLISCEVEVAGCDHPDYAGGIDRVCKEQQNSVVEDGSLPDAGFEINTAPASGDRFLARMRDLCEALGDAGARVDGDCGYHVHVDARDFDFWDVRRLVRLYAHVEQSLFDMVSRSRVGNDYCKPCGDRYLLGIGSSTTPKASFGQTLYKTTCHKELKSLKSDKRHSVRYHALNLHSWYFRGTVECRMHQGTVDCDKLTNWGMLWAGILDKVARTSDSAMDKFINSRPGGQALLDVAPTEAVRQYVRDTTLAFGRTKSPGLFREAKAACVASAPG